MELGTLATLTGAVLAVATFFIGRMSASNVAGKEAGTLATDIKYIKESIARIEKRCDADITRLEGRADEVSLQVSAMGQEVSRALEAARSAHTRLDEHMERDHPAPRIRRK